MRRNSVSEQLTVKRFAVISKEICFEYPRGKWCLNLGQADKKEEMSIVGIKRMV